MSVLFGVNSSIRAEKTHTDRLYMAQQLIYVDFKTLSILEY